MTNEEALRILLSDADFSGIGEKAKLTADALCVAIEALEKQIPKKPMKLVFVGSKELYACCCPKCEQEFLDIVPKYCCNCGQAIDWEEVSE